MAEKELAATRRDHDMDAIVVRMRQVAISTADRFSSATSGSGRNGCHLVRPVGQLLEFVTFTLRRPRRGLIHQATIHPPKGSARRAEGARVMV
jgi:hypothetical protein